MRFDLSLKADTFRPPLIMARRPVVLIIRDGWGINPGGKASAQQNGDATLLARTPFHNHLYAAYPWAKISGSGEDVGLPEGQMGNSEVGHLNLGAGRVVYQDLTRINKAIRDGELAKMPVLAEAFERCAGPTRAGEPVLNTQIVELAKVLAAFSGEKWTEVEKEIRVAHARSRASLLKTALQEAAHDPAAVRDALRQRTELVRSTLGTGAPAGPPAAGDATVPPPAASVRPDLPPVSGLHTSQGSAIAQPRARRLHLIGLVSDGGVHSHQDHLAALCNAAKAAGVGDMMVHAITDGRDTSPTGGAKYLAKLEADLKPSGAVIATVIGRYYAMDRDKRWERNKIAWDAIVLGRGEARGDTPSAATQAAYATEKRGDEFLLPMIFSHANEQRIRDGDVILWFNFRADRARQLSEAFLKADFAGFEREVMPGVGYYTLTEYDATYEALGARVIFGTETLDNNLGQVLAAAGLKQLRAAETEKYPHVTFFFNSGIEEPNPGEDRYLAVSPKEVPTYDKKPQMSAPDLTFEVLRRLEHYDAVIMNYANPDMVGHTGVVEAGVHACETIDLGVKLIVEKVLELGGKLFITADHGNCEQMRNADGSPHTAHTTNLVHGIYVAADAASHTVRDGILADIAPTLLAMLGLDQPAEMTGKSLLARK